MGPMPVTASMRRRLEPIEPSLTIFTGPMSPSGPHVGAAAQLGGVRTGLEHAHDVAVLVAEEGDGAELLGVRPWWSRSGAPGRWRGSRRWRGPRSRAICVGRHRLVVAEVEAQPVGVDERALLLDVLAEHLAQRPVEEVGGGVVAADGVAPGDVDGGGRLLARRRSRPRRSGPGGGAGRARRRRCRARRPAGVGRDGAGVAHLPAGLGVERRAVEARSTSASPSARRPPPARAAFALELVAADELGGPNCVEQVAGTPRRRRRPPTPLPGRPWPDCFCSAMLGRSRPGRPRCPARRRSRG